MYESLGAYGAVLRISYDYARTSSSYVIRDT
jgi:hypothetical protein